MLGRLGEELAAAHLRRLGFATLARNVRTRHGEIDLIVFDGRTLAFVEVKTRLARSVGQPLGPGSSRWRGCVRASEHASGDWRARGSATRATRGRRRARSASTRLA